MDKLSKGEVMNLNEALDELGVLGAFIRNEYPSTPKLDKVHEALLVAITEIGRLEAIVPEVPLEACYECPHRLEIKAKSQPATLDWVPTGSGLDAESRHAGAGIYHLCFVRLGMWVACLGFADIFRGNPVDCMDACEERERNPDRPPPKTEQ